MTSDVRPIPGRRTPLGLLALTATVGGLVMLACGCGRLSGHPVVALAREEVTTNPRVVELLAGPGGKVSCSNAVMGRSSDTDGIAMLQFEASGPRGKGTVVVEGKKIGREWGVTLLELRPATGGEHLVLTSDLEARTGTRRNSILPRRKPPLPPHRRPPRSRSHCPPAVRGSDRRHTAATSRPVAWQSAAVARVIRKRGAASFLRSARRRCQMFDSRLWRFIMATNFHDGSHRSDDTCRRIRGLQHGG
jgi:hypothetical protein